MESRMGMGFQITAFQPPPMKSPSRIAKVENLLYDGPINQVWVDSIVIYRGVGNWAD
jgi:hypothetical protein